MEDVKRWQDAEAAWWQRRYQRSTAQRATYPGSPAKPQGIRHFHREMLIRYSRAIVSGKIWIDVGAGDSFTIVDLLHPKFYQYHYIATDISYAALEVGRRQTAETPVVCAALDLPFLPGRATVVSSFGVLHHLPLWQASLKQMIDLLEPKGYLLLTEAITKPRILARWRDQSFTAEVDSPHEGDIDRQELVSLLTDECDILYQDLSSSPLRFVLLYFGKLDKLALRSYMLTKLLVMLDQAWISTVGRLFPSLGAGEIALVAQKRVKGVSAD